MARLLNLAVASFLAGAGMASAADVFFYSDVDEIYGWAAGYNYSRAEVEAHEQCENAGGSDCRFALECDGGWGSIAFTDDPYSGVGMSCGFASALDARRYALIECIIASNALCWTESSFNNNGRENSDADDLAFDTVWYAQTFLRFVHIDDDTKNVDGELGPNTRRNLRSFQKLILREETGELDDDLFWRLADAAQAGQAIAENFTHTRDKFISEDNYPTDRVYGYSSKPFPKSTYSEELATRSDVDRRLALSTLLNIWGEPCSVPAIRVEPLPADGSGFWTVSCEQGDFTISMDFGGSRMIAKGLYTLQTDGPEASGVTTVQPESKPSGEAAADADPFSPLGEP